MNWSEPPWGKAGSVLDNFNRDFRAIGLGEPRLVLKSRGHRAIADFVRVAEFVELEQFGRQRFAAGVALTLVLIDTYFQFSGHGGRSPGFAPIDRALYFHDDYRHAGVCSPAPKSLFGVFVVIASEAKQSRTGKKEWIASSLRSSQ
jgi:hypothetical protein